MIKHRNNTAETKSMAVGLVF